MAEKNVFTSKSFLLPTSMAWLAMQSVGAIEKLLGVEFPPEVANELQQAIVVGAVGLVTIVVRRVTDKPASFSAPVMRKPKK